MRKCDEVLEYNIFFRKTSTHVFYPCFQVIYTIIGIHESLTFNLVYSSAIKGYFITEINFSPS